MITDEYKREKIKIMQDELNIDPHEIDILNQRPYDDYQVQVSFWEFICGLLLGAAGSSLIFWMVFL